MTNIDTSKNDSNQPSNEKYPLNNDKKKQAEEFLKTVNSKLKKSERETWMLHDHDHLFDIKK